MAPRIWGGAVYLNWVFSIIIRSLTVDFLKGNVQKRVLGVINCSLLYTHAGVCEWKREKCLEDYVKKKIFIYLRVFFFSFCFCFWHRLPERREGRKRVRPRKKEKLIWIKFYLSICICICRQLFWKAVKSFSSNWWGVTFSGEKKVAKVCVYHMILL